MATNIISRSDIIEATPNLVNEIIQGVTTGSKVLPLMTELPRMTKSKEKLPVLSLLPEAYWVSGDTGLKGTTRMAWENKYIYAEEVAVVLPIPVNVLDDSDYDIIGQAKPRIIDAIDKKVDEAIITGKNKPAQFREGLIPTIINVGKNVAHSADDNTFTQISKAMGKVEQSGYDVNGLLGGVDLKQAFREGLRDTTGQPLANSEVTELPRQYVNNGAWNNTVSFIVGDFKQAVYSIRNDIEFKLFDSGVITDSTGNVIYNLMQQDMVALRVTFRMGWEVPNPINAIDGSEETRFPFALVEKNTAPTTYTLTVTVKDDAGSPAAISGATVVVGSQVKKTNASGVATFKSLGNETYLYKVSATGKKDVYGEVKVESSAKALNVTMLAKD